MLLSRNRLYLILLITSLAGYIWLYYNFTSNICKKDSYVFCIMKRLTGIPCPSCGSTRSIILLIKGNFAEAFKLNPLGYIIALIMLIMPLWIIRDLIMRKNSFFLLIIVTISHNLPNLLSLFHPNMLILF